MCPTTPRASQMSAENGCTATDLPSEPLSVRGHACRDCNKASDLSVVTWNGSDAMCFVCRLGFKIEQRTLLRRHIQQLRQCLDRASAELKACL